jgi:hypothetical protein
MKQKGLKCGPNCSMQVQGLKFKPQYYKKKKKSWILLPSCEELIRVTLAGLKLHSVP